MKKMMSLFVVLNLFAGSVFAQDKNLPGTENGGNNNQYNANNKASTAGKMADKCEAMFAARLKPAEDGKQAGVMPKNADSCDYFFYAANLIQENIESSEQTPSSDGAIVCSKKFGYTVDYDKCVSAIKKYNAVVIAEQAMQMQQGARQTITNSKTTNEVQKQAAAGNGQQAALDATISTNKKLAELNDEQKYMYSASVGALSQALLAWPEANKAGYRKVCKAESDKTKKMLKEKEGLHPSLLTVKCVDAIEKAKSYSKSAVFANDTSKAMLLNKTKEFVMKGITAGINADKLKNMANVLQGVQDSYEEEDMMLDKCVVTPSAPECKAPIVRGDVQAYQGGSFNLGAGSNTDHAFNNSPDDTFGINGAVPTDGAGTVADIKSPFEDEAKVASGILDPSNAATITPGSAGAGSGGGGGGGGGGGSASLGDDIKGAEAAGNKEAEIKSGKYSGAYGSNGGGGFQGVKGSGDEEANPLAGLVDSNGGVEEDRSIASEGIDGQDSGLFQKISNKYSQIQNEKRIEASNLE